MTPKSRMFVKKLNRISFVDNGACGGVPGNGGADIAIMKRAEKAARGAEPETFDAMRERMNVDRALGQMWEFGDRFSESLRSIAHSDKTDDEKRDLAEQSLKEYLQFLESAVPKWVAGQETEKRGGPMKDGDANKSVDLDKLDADALKRVATEATEKAAKLEADNAELAERVAALETATKKRAQGDGQGDEGDLDLTDETAFKRACKGQSEAVVRVLKATRQQALDARKEADEATKRSEEAQKRANEERDARELEVLTTKARKDLGGLAAKPEAIAALLQTAKRAMPDQYDELERVLSAASEHAVKGRIDREFGESALGDDESSATDIVLKRAGVLVAEKKVENIGDAMSQVLREDRDLRVRYERESQVRS